MLPLPGSVPECVKDIFTDANVVQRFLSHRTKVFLGGLIDLWSESGVLKTSAGSANHTLSTWLAADFDLKASIVAGMGSVLAIQTPMW